MRFAIKITHHPGTEHAKYTTSHEQNGTEEQIAEWSDFLMKALAEKKAIVLELDNGSDLILSPQIAQMSTFEIIRYRG